MPDRTLSEVAGWAAQTGLVQDLELGVGGYSPVPHCAPSDLLGHPDAIRRLKSDVEDAGLGISALNVSGNRLHPNPDLAQRHDTDLRNAIRLAAGLGVDRGVGMSGGPGAGASARVAPQLSAGGWLPDLAGRAGWAWRGAAAPRWSRP